jgi:hypothetical protein
MPGRQLPLTSRPVVNFASPLRDHTGYWRNRDEFVATLAATLADAAGQTVDRPGSSDASWRRLAAARRRWRVGWLQGLRLLAVATAAVLLVVNAGHSAAIGRRAVDLATSRADLLLVDWSSGASVPPTANRGAGCSCCCSGSAWPATSTGSARFTRPGAGRRRRADRPAS